MPKDLNDHILSLTTLSSNPTVSRSDPVPVITQDKFRILFQPTFIDSDPPAFKGAFIFERRSSINEPWPTGKDFTRRSIEAGKRAYFEFHSDELSAIYNQLSSFDEFTRNEFNKSVYLAIDQFASRVELTKMLKSNFDLRKHPDLCDILCRLLENENINIDTLKKMLQAGDTGLLIFEELSKLPENEIKEVLHKLGRNIAGTLHNYISIDELEDIKKQIEQHMDDNEHDWKKFLSQYPVILSQLFIHPFVIYKKEAKTGGGDLEKIGGICDYLLKNEITDNITFLEIKKPGTELVQKSEYREGPGVYPISADLTGAIVQVNGYRDDFLKEYYKIRDKQHQEFIALNPQCVVIAGNTEKLSDERLRSFELFRSNLTGTIVITFDELCKRIQLVIDLIVQANILNQQQGVEDNHSENS